ncbi:hypothetical protein B0A48_17842 [Cryoendolithus antarcticus]|uniref:Molybdate-anion transporter n=1 Tax=Cryoendolithus antarcticus TaxID=1507870 RepID=A0A1V8SBJ0_9PEZI|nr:hypothetical protein B0A48_17842 [Cryoendolithus antarcticus]
MEPYAPYFASLLLFNLALYLHTTASSSPRKPSSSLSASSPSSPSLLPRSSSLPKTTNPARAFMLLYFTPYTLAVAADWLQGPYMYTLYHDEKSLSEPIVAALFMTGFASAAVTACFAGGMADKRGRRAGCLVYCVAYAVSCLTVLSDNLVVLFIGRLLGGLSTTLLYSVFETWMISEYRRQEMSAHLELGEMFGLSVTLSGVTAIVAGVVGEALVRHTGAKTAPFVAAALCLGVAFCLISQRWTENYGTTTSEERLVPPTSLRSLITDTRLLTLSLSTLVFEGSMYLFVFFWAPSLIASRALSAITATAGTPFGLIFSCFMAAMMIGSLSSSMLGSSSGRHAGARMLMTVMAVAATALLLPVMVRSEGGVFWSFALFEVCVGMYYPTISRLKSEMVEESVRGRAYGLMRMPLNVFVVVSLAVTREGEAHRDLAFTVCGGMLLSGFFAVKRYLE